MAIQQVRARFNGQWVTLVYDPATDAWAGEFTPESTSHHQPGGYYNIEVEAVNDSGTAATFDGDDLDSLRLIVNEKAPPRLTLISPAEGYVTTNQPEIVFYAEDEEGGSGVDIASLVITVDGETAAGAQWIEVKGGYRISYTPAESLTEGPHQVKILISDYDGNTAQMELSYTVDTIPPALTVREPNVRTVFDTPAIILSGTATDVTAPVTVKVEINGGKYAETTVSSLFGEYQWEIPLEVGGNEITVTAIDGVGWETKKELFLIRLVTDRTQADVNALEALLAKPFAQWTPDELAGYLEAMSRGGYNYTDLNRVNLAVRHLGEKFAGYGYDPELIPDEDWAEDDFPTPEEMGVYLENLRRLRALMPISTPLPESMEDLGIAGANQIEAVLVELDRFAPLVINTFYAGEIYSGET